MENINEEANLREYFLNLLSKSEIKVPDEKITQMLKFLEPMTPFPAARPSALTTIGAPSLRIYARAGSASVKTS